MSYQSNFSRTRSGARLVGANSLKEARKNARQLSYEEEHHIMDASEAEQCSHKDKFWGKDYEEMRMKNNQKLMAKEFLLSSKMEMYYKDMGQQKAWEDEYMIETQQEAFTNAVNEERRRGKYLKSLFKSTSSEMVCNYSWTLGRVQSASGTKRSNFDPTLEILNPEFVGTQTTFHLEGLQQARALSMDSVASSSTSSLAPKDTLQNHSLGPLMRGRATTPGIAQDKMMSLVEEGNNSSIMKDQSKSFLHMFGPDEDMNSIIFGKHKNKKIDITDAMKRTSQSFDGHPYYKWDQELILREVFDSLDTEQKGVLFPEHLMNLASSSQLQYLLSFTVFGPWVKCKKWTLLLNTLFDNGNNNITVSSDALNTNSVANGENNGFGNSNGSANLNRWFSAALALSRETNKSLKHIRTDDEHLELLTYNDNFHSLDGNSIEYATLARRQHNLPYRETYTSKCLDIGDVVWALPHSGYKWLPAVIESINQNNMTYGIKYTLSQSQLRAARKKCIGTEILGGKRINRPNPSLLSNQIYEKFYLNDKTKYCIDSVLNQENTDEIRKAVNDILAYNQFSTNTPTVKTK
jgi:hypothetical protein